jgi:type I restriction enzyme, S subunit
MSATLPLLANLRPNAAWGTLPLFDRTGWMRVRFGDVVENCAETCDPGEAGLERFVAMEHLEPGSLLVRSWGNVADGTTFTRRCRPGQVLFGKRRAYQRKVAVAEFEAVVSGDIYVLAPKDGRLLPELLPFLCLSERFFQHAVGTSAGSLSPRTNWSSLASFEFDLPPLDQQRRIAEILWAADKAAGKFGKAAVDAEKLRLKHLHDTFSNVHRSDAPLVKDAGEVLLGRRNAPEYRTLKYTYPYLRVANVMDGFIDFNEVSEMNFADGDLDRYRLKPGDILLNEGQSNELIGRSAIFNGEVENCCFQSTLLRFRAKPGLLTGWAQAYFQHCRYRGVFAALAPQTTSMAHLTAVRFGTMRIPVPDIRTQEGFVARHSEIREALRGISDHLVTLREVSKSLLNAVT